jgi:hypothetical protein
MTRPTTAFATYDLWEYPYFPDPFGMSLEQRADALHNLLAITDHRLAKLQATFPALQPVVAQCLDASRPLEPAVAELEDWWQKTFSRVDVRPHQDAGFLQKTLAYFRGATGSKLEAPQEAGPEWFTCPEARARPVLAAIGDVAVLLGATVVARNPKFRWAVDNHPGHRRRVIPETLRIVVMSETQPRRDPAAFDFYRRAITSYERLFAEYKNSTVQVSGVYNSDFTGWDAVNAVNGHCD